VALEWQESQGLEIHWLDTPALRELEPAITPEVRGALFSPEEGHVRSPRLTTALAVAAGRKGAQVRQGMPVSGLLTEGKRVIGVQTPSGNVLAGQVVLAAGPWTAMLTADLSIALPVRPVKGQLLALAAMPAPLQHVIYCTGTGYLVPKADGTIVVGATQEETGFDKRVTVRGVNWLLDGAVRLVPGLGNAEVRDLWAGLRPGSPDGSPILGAVPGWSGVTLATGHFRNGILLAPITGKLIAELLTTGKTSRDITPFSLTRFAEKATP
jgi:glycine oxidase